MLSPTAQPFSASGPVAAFLHEQEMASIASPTQSMSAFLHENRKHREFMTERLSAYQIDEDQLPATPLPPREQPLLPGFQSPPRTRPVAPPTPAESIPVSTYEQASPVVRLTKGVWDAMNHDLQTLKTQKRDLETDIASLRRQYEALLNQDHDDGARLGKLVYQNEANRDQKATMGRTLAQKDVVIKKQQLDLEELTRQVAELETNLEKCSRAAAEAEWLRSTLRKSDDAHAHDMATQAKIAHNLESANNCLASEAKTAIRAQAHVGEPQAIRELQADVKRLTSERDNAIRAHAHVGDLQAKTMRELQAEVERVKSERDTAIQIQARAGDHATHARNLADTLAKREKLQTELRLKVVEEGMRCSDLEEKIERLREKFNPEEIENLKEQLREKTSLCDRYRNEAKYSQKQYALSQERLKKAGNNGDNLRGGAHLVAPNEKTKLPKNVVTCSECYGMNLNCDSAARCRSCVEGGTKCTRWRCSLKQKIGECDMTPCLLPHDSQGWLVTPTGRPEW
jgi:hypothetical protein